MIWNFQDALTRRLLLWSALSMAAGLMLLILGDPFARGLGVQALAWGLIDAGIAWLGRRSAEMRLLKQIKSGQDRIQCAASEARNLRRLLWINVALDVLYIAGGVVLVVTLGRSDAFARGNGWGVVVQGGFLFVFDLLHALLMPLRTPAMPPWDAFGGAEHQPFTLRGDRPAALLLHGFLGTPAEMRGLGEALHQQGWTVRAPLLPGFGSEIDTLTERRWQEWRAATRHEIEALTMAGHRPLLLVGYSMGAALSLMEGNDRAIAGLVLLAPLAWREPWWLRPAEWVVRPFLPLSFRPLRKADFGDGQLRAGIRKFMPDLDLDDPAVRSAVRDFRVPLGLIDQLRNVSRGALSAARDTDRPVLIVQGTRDRIVRVSATQRLVAKLPKPPVYVEVDSDHNLSDTANPAWIRVRQAVLDFATSVFTGAR